MNHATSGSIARTRPWLIAAAATVAMVAAATLFLRFWTSPRLEESGGAVAVVDGHSLALNRGSSGVGIGGRLELLGGRCIGFGPSGDSPGLVIVWPAGTTVRGEGADLRMESNGRSIRIGERLEGGSEQRTDLAGLERLLPPACTGFTLVDVTPGG